MKNGILEMINYHNFVEILMRLVVIDKLLKIMV